MESVNLFTGHWIHSVSTGESTEIWRIIPRMEPRNSKTGAMGKFYITFIFSNVLWPLWFFESDARYYCNLTVDPHSLRQKNNSRPVKSSVDQSRGLNSGAGPALLFAAKLDERNITVSPSVNPGGARNPVESDMTSANAMDRHPGFTNKSIPFPISLQPNFNPGRTAGAAAQFPPRLASDAENMASQTQPQSCHARSCSTDEAVASDKLKEKDLTVEGGKISISNAYSQGWVCILQFIVSNSFVMLIFLHVYSLLARGTVWIPWW